MKVPFVTLLTLVLSASTALANSALDPGKPAGVRQAQLEGGDGMLVVAGAALAGIAIALATASDNNAQPTSTSPSVTSTTGTSP